MLNVAKPKYLFIIALATVLGLFTLGAHKGLAQTQQNTEVRAEVCNSAGPVVSFTSPQSDSVTDSRTITLSGTTQRTSQVDVSINGNYSQSLAVDSSNTFTAQVSLQEGTNNISLDAFYSCNQLSQIFTVVVTYSPRVVSSNGSDLSTETIKPGNTAPGIISNPNKSSFYTDYVVPIQSWVSVVAALITVLMVFLLTLLLSWIFNKFGQKNIVKRHNTLLRLIAVILAVIFAIIIQV